MLVYHPAFDANHCAYRLIHILIYSENEYLDWEKLRLADFYYLFPCLLSSIKPLPKSLSKARKYFSNIPVPYENIPNPKRIFFDLRDIQNSTIASLISKQIIDRDLFCMGKVSIVKENVPESLVSSFEENIISSEKWFVSLVNGIQEVEISGSKGLKARSGLMEYRYDQ